MHQNDRQDFSVEAGWRMETSLNEHELAAALPDVLDRVRRGERFVVERDGTWLAILEPPDRPMATGITGRALAARIGKLRMPGNGFADDIESARSALIPARVPPWHG
jgi:antitoxin (DNA-binding transcriptional repressor) of toxin-antitoxin stability system